MADYNDLECGWLAEMYVALYWDIFDEARALRSAPDPNQPEGVRRVAEGIQAAQKALESVIPRQEFDELVTRYCPAAFYDAMSKWKGEQLAGKKT